MTFLRGITLDNVDNVRELISLEITLFLLTTPVAYLVYTYIKGGCGYGNALLKEKVVRKPEGPTAIQTRKSSNTKQWR